MSLKKALTLLGVGSFAFLYFYFDLGHYFTIDYFKEQQGAFENFYAENPALCLSVFSVIYILTAALALPGAAVLTLVSGALFGVGMGTLVVSFASTIGATLSFLVARFLLRDSLQKKFKERMRAVNAGIKKNGAFYLFTLRLIPVFPFFLVNLLTGLTPLRTFTFFWVSQIGMLPGTFVYVNAGTQIASIDSLAGILSPELFLSFALLGIFPLFAKKLVEKIEAKKVYKGFKKPKKIRCEYDCDWSRCRRIGFFLYCSSRQIKSISC